MNLDKVLKNEGIKLVSNLKPKKIDFIAHEISSKICASLPEHNLNKLLLYNELSKVNMFLADFVTSDVGAKYYYKNKSIYFNRKYSSKKLLELSVHESIHFIQEKRNPNGSLSRFGLYNLNFIKSTGLNLNEAAVQLMTVYINQTKPDYVKYYGLSFYTPSPDYYPIECALLNQIVYFIGTYPLFHSTLYSDDVFKNTFITKTNKKTYYFIESAFDTLANYEDKLSKLLYSLANNTDDNISKLLNTKIEQTKESISNLVLNVQELILQECFNSEIHNAKSIETINEIRNKLINIKKYLIQKENYKFYDIFSCEILGKLDEKEKFIKEYGIEYYFKQNNNYLPILVNQNFGISLFNKLLLKTRKMFSIQKKKKEHSI